MDNSNDQDDISTWINKDHKVLEGAGEDSYKPAEPLTKKGPHGKLNLRLAKFGGLMLAAIYFPILYALTGLNSLRDLAVYLILVAVTGGICSLPPLRPAFERSIRYFTTLMVTAIALAAGLIIYKAFF